MNKIEKKEIMKIIGDVLKTARHQRVKKITQEEIAHLIGISQEQYSRIERGNGRLSIIELHVICNRLGLPMTEFVIKVENYLCGKSQISPERKKKFQRWLRIYQEYYGIK